MQLGCINVLHGLNCLVKLSYFLVSVWDFKGGEDLNTQYPVECLTETESEIPHRVCENDVSKVLFFQCFFFFSIARELIKISI